MDSQKFRFWQRRAISRLIVLVLVSQTLVPAFAAAKDNSNNTRTPIKHVIVIIGENRTFDHVFATYKPKKGETVANLLSKHIINEDGTPGPNYFFASQFSAVDTDKFQISPGERTLFSNLPTPLAGGPTEPFFATVAAAKKVQIGLPSSYYKFMTTGGTGLAPGVPDTRISNVTNLPPGPFQLTSPTLPYDAYATSPVHRFYQMWQQFDCNVGYSTSFDPSGCLADLFAWVEITIGAGSNGKPQPAGFNALSTGEGGTALGFYNVLQGRCSLPEIPCRPLRHERQLPSVRNGRHRS
jgi:phospholipase C